MLSTAQIKVKIQGGKVTQPQQDAPRPAASPQPREKLTNQDVIDMGALKLSDDVIIDKIRGAEATAFDTSVKALKTLKSANVPDAVIRVMINTHSIPAAAPAGASESSGLPQDTNMPQEIGVYILLKGHLTEIEPEVVGWQTGGMLKAMATGGLTRGHINGKVTNPKSSLQVPTPVEIYIRTPEGTGVTEYQLLRLDEHGNRREFRAITGGILHASSGAERNAEKFEPGKVGKRTWRILLNLKKGEYGFLPPGVSSASISSSGKLFTFGVIE
jgi:hypothetical protein